MSGQMSDVIVVDGVEYAVVEPAIPEKLFDPRDHGVAPVMLHTANMRGVSARYRISDGQLMLSELQVGSLEAPPEINGVEPSTDEHAQTWTYLDLNLPVAFSGDLIVGAQPILDLYVHRGFLPVWHYETVFAFDLEEGLVQSSEDRSGEVAIFRAERMGQDEPDEDEGMFESFLSSIRIRLGLDDPEDS